MSNFVIEVMTVKGADLHDVCQELCDMANDLQVNVKTTFNSIILFAGPGGDFDVLKDAYWNQISKYQVGPVINSKNILN